MLTIKDASPTLVQRFWSYVDKNGPIPDYAPHLGPCWIWTASCDGKGYGQIPRGTSPGALRAHRVSYEIANGSIDAALVLDHLCRVKHCVNPDHLEQVTQAENIDRGVMRGRRHAAKLAVTHCPRGHEYTPENTYVSAKGCRSCRTCHRDYMRETYRMKEKNQSA